MKNLLFPAKLGLRALAQLLSPAGSRASLIVLIYHRVLAAADPLLPDEPDAATFAAHMDVLSGLFNVLPLSEAAARLQASPPPRDSCAHRRNRAGRRSRTSTSTRRRARSPS